MDMMEIGALIKARRVQCGLNQMQLAEQAGVSRATLSALENGHLPELGVNRLLRILEAVQFDMNFTPSMDYRPTMDELQNKREQDDAPRTRSRYRG
ncbi:helix-turn-helix domain-containing protein [Allopusillimonas ginsengisoli]|uniref:helix-turn-helix domain-containing protein n=1 Tax=Allopusillimonas ginsengisoli TaxID=453575 RepID=UPI00101F2B23|nr:helix-turn-helix domain-containing protein [Allopusillimonas ginsengisoli]TEA79918.1 helix-turn-helix domain-containing protein [Allopusillimonas ginsengisoli]